LSFVLEETRRSYALQRGVSQGASITLIAKSGGYEARFDCARKCAATLGDRHLEDGRYLIPTEELHRSITKLAERYSVALLDTVTDEHTTRFVLVWKILPRGPESVEATTNLDEY